MQLGTRHCTPSPVPTLCIKECTARHRRTYCAVFSAWPSTFTRSPPHQSSGASAGSTAGPYVRCATAGRPDRPPWIANNRATLPRGRSSISGGRSPFSHRTRAGRAATRPEFPKHATASLQRNAVRKDAYSGCEILSRNQFSLCAGRGAMFLVEHGKTGSIRATLQRRHSEAHTGE